MRSYCRVWLPFLGNGPIPESSASYRGMTLAASIRFKTLNMWYPFVKLRSKLFRVHLEPQKPCPSDLSTDLSG